MTRIDSATLTHAQDGTVPSGSAPSFAHAATPEQAAALYDEQARKAAAVEAALDGMGFAALPAMSVRSLDAMTQGNDVKLARSRIKQAEPPKK
ncbi:hypothetical protein GCM10027277_26210 [Pseudoduganella ginsengisoli]|uniref:Uncharacterized protein n=1 Tax=Pseudoduganella ginsengisoli TaxID=1462440 RepID=A0A6L6Q3C5_9BURK|nr:hypothetical protein [Pseudoduganella ginsengisoli]MTW03572.1 hypothetical protein [Pseudoduganella ginsengisoli]